MKLSNLLVVGMKACLTGLLIHLLLVKANITGERDFHNLVCYQLLMPFPVTEGETVDFVKVITLLGLSFNSFYFTISFLADLAEGAKEVFRFHARNQLVFFNKLWRTSTIFYLKEWLLFIVLVLGVLMIYYGAPHHIEQLCCLMVSWLTIDICLLYVMIRYASSAVVAMILFASLILIRYFLFDVWWCLLLIVLVHMLYDNYYKES
ncbi:TPA: hypothetical protein TUY02_000543 [Streptococcus equi subsp. zooepidemicus]|uniref:hypothetical protein n=1 Tax=Streptococcus equi TaxID=1336 RepID=UPI00197E8991|nr:hypothetical protein [Streptococcus equi]QTZ56157.1 hypothetical protein JFMEOBDD_00205 [Streptococcus equi subsp. zooepidemicus]HEK9073452.1 hypothetical protein [Streptococcus equi subsp. zooepidemicus]HEK9999672.1 hypothetical protein [Streptococcus equi subsp. zooepidemicus]HEL0594944.1 hypothetical protein [Streptococcus equi subsp. zooepidemicus]HEL0615956.1 hypothetical protein [Streptococcus equi subsp. zooepidemicus]